MAGFKVSHHVVLNRCQADLLAELDLPDVQKDFRVICKFRHADTEDAVKDLIIEWVDKNKEIKADKVIIAIDGIEVLGEDREMAKEKGVIILEKDNIQNYLERFRKNRADGIRKIKGIVGIDPYFDSEVNYIPPGANE